MRNLEIYMKAGEQVIDKHETIDETVWEAEVDKKIYSELELTETGALVQRGTLQMFVDQTN